MLPRVRSTRTRPPRLRDARLALPRSASPESSNEDPRHPRLRRRGRGVRFDALGRPVPRRLGLEHPHRAVPHRGSRPFRGHERAGGLPRGHAGRPRPDRRRATGVRATDRTVDPDAGIRSQGHPDPAHHPGPLRPRRVPRPLRAAEPGAGRGDGRRRRPRRNGAGARTTSSPPRSGPGSSPWRSTAAFATGTRYPSAASS